MLDLGQVGPSSGFFQNFIQMLEGYCIQQILLAFKKCRVDYYTPVHSALRLSFEQMKRISQAHRQYNLHPNGRFVLEVAGSVRVSACIIRMLDPAYKNDFIFITGMWRVLKAWTRRILFWRVSQTRHLNSMFASCWASVEDNGSTLRQHCVNVL